ncbi:MAG: ABC transporter permease [Fimbriimonadaceae bacterium]|nr:ABC transporter permease [Fimbriimonadaceae bacterium]
MKPLTPRRLLASNLARRRFRTTALLLTVAVVAGGIGLLTALLRGMQQSVALGTARLGADLVVIPRGSRAAAEGALIVGEATQLTMPASQVARIAALPGVAQASAQVYVKTLTDARCCPGEFFLIGFDPATDFSIAPWLRQRGLRLGSHDAVVGDRVTLRDGATVPFFGTPFTVRGHLDPTGVGLDTTVFLPLDGLRDMVAHSPQRAEEPLEIAVDEVSVVLVKTAPGVPASHVAEAVTANLDGLEVVLAPQVIGAAMRDLGGVLRLLVLVGVALWGVLLPLLGTTFSMAVAERRRDIGVWRALGASAGWVFRLVLAEAAVICGLGALLGLAVAAVLTTGFGAALAAALGTPYVWIGWPWVIALTGGIAGSAVATGCLAAWLPARAAARLDPYECIRAAGV